MPADPHTLLGYLAGFLDVAGGFPYLYAIYCRQTRPNRASWFVWALTMGITTFSYAANGATTTLWQPICSTFMTSLIFFISLRYGVGGMAKLDLICIGGSAATLFIWALTGDPFLALLCIITVNLLGCLPTFYKTWRDPQSEDSLSWFLWSASTVANLFALSAWTLELAVYPLYIAAACIIPFLLTLRRAPHTKN